MCWKLIWIFISRFSTFAIEKWCFATYSYIMVLQLCNYKKINKKIHMELNELWILLMLNHSPLKIWGKLCLSCLPRWGATSSHRANFLKSKFQCALWNLAWDVWEQLVHHLSRQRSRKGCTHYSSCSHCESMSLSSISSRINFFYEGPPPHSTLPIPSNPKRKKQRSSGSFSGGTSSVTSRQCVSHKKTSTLLLLWAAWFLSPHLKRTSLQTTPCPWHRSMHRVGR